MDKRLIFLISITFLVACSTAIPEPTETPSPTLTPEPTSRPTRTPFVAVGQDIQMALPDGDPDRGLELVRDKGCLACHGSGSGLGAAWEPTEDLLGIGERAEMRFMQDDYSGQATSAEQYLFESITNPGAYVVEGFTDGIMPPNFADLLSAQEVADMISYLLTIR